MSAIAALLGDHHYQRAIIAVDGFPAPAARGCRCWNPAPPVGSSQSSTAGPLGDNGRSRPGASPPESWAGKWSALLTQPDQSQRSSADIRALAISVTSSTFFRRAVRLGNQVCRTGTRSRHARDGTCQCRLVGASQRVPGIPPSRWTARPAAGCSSSVDLPLPHEAPNSTTNSPARTGRGRRHAAHAPHLADAIDLSQAACMENRFSRVAGHRDSMPLLQAAVDRGQPAGCCPPARYNRPL